MPGPDAHPGRRLAAALTCALVAVTGCLVTRSVAAAEAQVAQPLLHRKDVKDLTRQERDDFVKAVLRLKARLAQGAVRSETGTTTSSRCTCAS